MFAQCIVVEELAKVCATSALTVSTAWVMTGVVDYGTEAQQQEIIPPIVRGESRPAWALTEPKGGSDLMSTTTRATRTADGWVLNGTKRFSTNGGWADLYLTNQDGPNGPGAGDGSERDSDAPEHAIDNNDRKDSMLLTFGSAVNLTHLQIGYRSGDSDMTVLAFTGGIACAAYAAPEPAYLFPVLVLLSLTAFFCWSRKNALQRPLMLLVWLVMTWKLWEGMLEKKEYLETTFILQMPVWWGYAASMVPAVVGCVAYAWRLLESLGLAERPAGFVAAGGGH